MRYNICHTCQLCSFPQVCYTKLREFPLENVVQRMDGAETFLLRIKHHPARAYNVRPKRQCSP